MKRVTNFVELLSGPICKSYIDDIVNSVSHHPEDFYTLYALMNHSDIKVSWRSIWALEKLSEIHPDWFSNYQNEITERLIHCTHDGKKRLLLSILYNLPIPSPIQVHFLDYCLSHMLDLNESIGVQALAIKMAYKLCVTEPDLLYELKMYLENAESEYYS
ncbi:hypothetical protein LJB80_01655, partial [Bacteroides sp. OttesenSCG-928-F21]|nr:hypothetical protein [Bacteroides sp. OttesenSCG-928-F21]